MSAVTTTAAATQAGVTVATIRTWCRVGAVAAIKKAGRWAIDTTSLAYRITLGARLSRKTKPLTLTTEKLIAIGGSRWQRGDKDRVYINNWAQYAGLEVTRYASGRINGATLGGKDISNSLAQDLTERVEKVWFDAETGNLHASHYNATEVQVRYLDGTRDTINLLARTFDGITAAAL